MAKKNPRKRNPGASFVMRQGSYNAPAKAMKISACWIVKNEEKNLPRSIKSLSQVANELIVVDTGSDDTTVEVAKALNAKVFDFEWINDFSAAKNYALSKASGDVVIFLDADEWFQPGLTRKDIQVINRLFAQPNVEGIYSSMTNINEDTEKIMDTTETIRIFRLHPSIRFVGSIHEMMQKNTADGWRYIQAPRQKMFFNVNHSGYSSGVIQEKLERNINLLNSAVQQVTNPYELFLLHSYLLREYSTFNKYEEAFPHLQFILDHSDYVDRSYREFTSDFLQRILFALYIGKIYRHLVSRNRIYDAIVLPAKKYYSSTDYQIIDLYYQLLFECQPDRFLEDFSSIIPMLDAETGVHGAIRQKSVYMIKIQAASIYLEMKALDRVFPIIDGIVQNPDYRNAISLSLLINCLYDQPDATVIPYLLSILDFDKPEHYSVLSESLVRAQRKSVFLFIQKRLLDAGKLSKPDFLYLMLVNGNYEQLGKIALSMDVPEDEMDMGAEIDRQLFLATLASGDDDFYIRHKDRLTMYEKIIDSFFSGVPLTDATEGNFRILVDNYHLLAFAAGPETADRLIAVFAAYPNRCFSFKAKHYFDSHQDSILSQLDRKVVPLWEKDTLFYLCRSMARCGKEEDALDILEDMLRSGYYDDQLFQLLFVLSQVGQIFVSVRARDLYDSFWPVYDKLIDSQDDGTLIHTEMLEEEKEKNDASIISLDAYRETKALEPLSNL